MTYSSYSRLFAGKIRLPLAALIVLILPSTIAKAQTNPTSDAHPLQAIMQNTRSALKPELRGRHPRLFVTEEGLNTLRQRSRGVHRELWQRTLANLRALKNETPASAAQNHWNQAEVGLAIAEAALAFKIEGDPKYLDAARRYLETAAGYAAWGPAADAPLADSITGHLLYGMSWGYDLLYWDLKDEERDRYSGKIARHARMLAQSYQPKPGRLYAYNQTRLTIPMAGLATAAYALYEDIEDAPDWARLARAVFERILTTYTPDAYCHEGFENWASAAPSMLHYLDVHAHATGEDLYDRTGLRRMHLYIAHTMLPGGKDVFDFGDAYAGPVTRRTAGSDASRSRAGAGLLSNYNVLYRIASRFNSEEAQGIAEWLKSLGQINGEDCWSLLWFDPAVPALPMEQIRPWHYFDDHELVFWRTDWSEQATAIAFKCGPPEGHHVLPLLQELADWQPAPGQAHPDANSFILFARGRYLTGDSGTSSLPMTAQHNTLLVGGRGQAREGHGPNAFEGVPYNRLNGIRIADMRLGPNLFYVVGDAAAAYEPDIGLIRYERQLLLTPPDGLVITDEVAAKQPQPFAMLFHSDSNIKSTGGSSLTLGEGPPALLATVVLPPGAKALIEPNVVAVAGKPGPTGVQIGPVDATGKQLRGNRVAVTTSQPMEQARFITVLKFQ